MEITEGWRLFLALGAIAMGMAASGCCDDKMSTSIVVFFRVSASVLFALIAATGRFPWW